MSALTVAGSTRAWRTLRLEVLVRDDYVCHWCAGFATHVDHLLARARGGTDDPENLVASCAACNLSRGVGPGPRTVAPSRNW